LAFNYSSNSANCNWLVGSSFGIALLVFFIIPISYAAEPCDPVVGRVVDVAGRVEIQRGVDARWAEAKLEDALCEGDTVRASERSRAAVALVNQAILRIDQSTTIRLINIKGKPEERSLLSLVKGAIQSFSRKPRQFEISTPYLNGSIEGTEFVFRVADNQTILTVFEGIVRVANEQGVVSVASGQSVAAEPGKAPQPRTVVRPRDAAQWALYYPPVLSGDQGLQQVAQDLSVGRVAEARTGIDKALAANPKNGLALALRSVMHTTQNNRVEAMADAQKAVAASPGETASWIALSYAQQSRGDIAGARDSVNKAIEKQPKDALVWARRAELELMMGERRRSAQAADTAVQLAPNLSRAYLARGFAALTERRVADAQVAFKKAIALDSADPLPRLGLGIAKINSGDLEGGRRELEVAIAMDSNNALYRAYLGKAYYEEKRGPLDADQLVIAKELDPQDPTAYFYNAIRLQTENQPIPALKEVDASIERNDNRAVHRSRLLLDSDEAARTVSQARIYKDLGFQQLALVEGWKSANKDPSDASAHRFLADSYSVLPRHEVARVSELFQSQLLDPLNLAPIQPRAAESSLGLISAGGPATASANEFNSLFKRNHTNLLFSGTVAELDTASGDIVVGGIHDNWSFSVGASHFKTDGFRENNDQEDTIGNVFTQVALSPETSAQFEYRRRKTENGDLNLRINRSFSQALRSETESDTYRVGLRHVLSPNSILLASVMRKEENSFFFDEPGIGSSIKQEKPDDKALGSELQYLYRSENFSITTGGGYFDIDEIENTTSVSPLFCLPFPPFTCFGGTVNSSRDLGAEHRNVYVYSNIRVNPEVTLALGASVDSFETKNTTRESKDQFNPKLGVIWQVQPGTTLRAAGFRVLKRSLVTDQTLEPTQVAGFNQFYDDVASTDAWRYGIALDQKFTRTVFGGVEVSRRDLTVPFNIAGTPVQKTEQDHEEDLVRAYLFLTPTDRIGLSMEYLYERIDKPFSIPGFPTSVTETKVDKIPLGFRYFSPSGWTFGVKGTYVRENFYSGVVGSVTEQNSQFWLVDAMASYRLSQRRGFVSIGAINLFDRNFAYEQLDAINTEFQPSRMLFARVTLLY
jgi:Tfp pilus assembly protein PilF